MKKIVLFIVLSGFVVAGAQQPSPEVGIIPTPQEMTMKKGVFSLDKPVDIFTGEAVDTSDLFSALQLQEELNNAHVMSMISTRIGKGHGIYLVNLSQVKDRRKDEQEQSEISKTGPEGYRIEISPERIMISANTSTGIFYGIQSLKQLIRMNYRNRTIPCLSINDWPGLKYRGWMVDVSRGPIPTLNFLKKQVRTMAEYKQNYLNLYIEHVFRLKSYPDIAPAEGITADDIMELQDYARRYHVELIGNQQCLGHMEHILEIPFYHDISDNGWNLNPGKEETYQFLGKMFAEEAPVYRSSLFNINCDETDALGSGKAAEYVESNGMETVYARHVNRVADTLKKYGKRTMMWGDIAVNHQKIIQSLPRDLIIISWGYDARSSFVDAIKPFKESGFDFMVAPGVSCWSQIYPDLHNAAVNIFNYVRDGAMLGALGMMNTCWADDGENLSNYNWHGLVWGAEVSWKTPLPQQGDASQKELADRLARFNHSFDLVFFGNQDMPVTNLLMAFDTLRQMPVRGVLSDNGFWSSMLEFYPENVDKETEMNNIPLEVGSKRLVDKLQKAKNTSVYHKDVLDYAMFAARRSEYMAKRNLARLRVYHAFESGSAENVRRAQTSTTALIQELGSLRQEYSVLWNQENRGWWLDRIKSRYDRAGDELLNLEYTARITGTPKAGQGVMEISLRSLYGNQPVYYTTDGSEPTLRSAKYTAPFMLSEPSTVRARVIADNTLYPEVSKSFYVHKGVGCLRELHSQYSNYNPAYTAGGDGALLDGLRGSDNFADGRWQGYQGTDIDLVIDLQKVTPVNTIQAGFLQNAYSWILMPSVITVYTSDDGVKYLEAGSVKNEVDPHAQGTIVKDYTINLNNLKTRYLRVVAKNPGPLPAWHQAAGSPSYMFCDEIIIE